MIKIRVCFLLMVCAYVGVPSQAIGSVSAQFAALESASLAWSERQEMRLFGVPAFQRSFSSTESEQNVAEILAAHTDMFQRAMAFRNKTVLSGVRSDWHWVAEIDSAPFGVRGSVSALRISGPELNQAVAIQSEPGFSWLPQQAKRRFSQRTTVMNRQVLDEVYSTALRADELLGYLQKQLRLKGWIDEPGLAWLPNMSVWRRRASELTLISSASHDGSALFIHYLE
ncbi:MAG: hypothetical protein ABI228_01750 [Burkholderiaceae bacterium]